MAFIYALRHWDTGRCYIGHTSRSPQRRYNEHKAKLVKGEHSSPHLQYAWDKYGEEAFEFVVLEECSDYIKVDRENYHLRVNGTFNAAPVGGSCLGVSRSEETKQKIREANLGQKRPPELCKKLSAWQTGRKLTKEHKRNIGLGQKGKVVSEETRAKMSAWQKGFPKPSSVGNTARLGIPTTPEAKLKISAALIGRVVSEETRQKISKAMTGKKRGPYKKRVKQL